MRRAARKDINEPAIVDELEKRGYSVEKDHNDILVGYKGKTYWYEIKSDWAVSKKTGKVYNSKIKDSQKEISATYKGHYKIVTSAQEIIDDIKQSIGD